MVLGSCSEEPGGRGIVGFAKVASFFPYNDFSKELTMIRILE